MAAFTQSQNNGRPIEITESTLPSLKPDEPKAILLKDYQKPNYLIPEVSLRFEMGDDATVVRSKLAVERNQGVADGTPLVLNGEKIALKSVKVDGRTLQANEYEVTSTNLTIPNVPKSCSVEIETIINPSANKSGQGLYKSGSTFCTQMEAEGFRNVTYFPDRPDVMAKYTTTIVADKNDCPVLLSNGNPIASGDIDGKRHFVTWQDPFAKPSYLFALVSGQLEVVEDHYVTKSGRDVKLQIFVEKGNEKRCEHAMESLKRAMRWDEEEFGLEYDLDIFMVVVVNDFNAGAMENKGLNIFNSKYALADPETATDLDFIDVEGVIGHEYFHNWTGDRVTCRDWFQLTLKEGLTVFRDQEFTSDMNSRAVKRIADVRRLRMTQFPEDAGPNAHPIRPESYIAIDNFYTPTVYRKGAEVIRMIDTMIGRDNFKKGITKYFELYDGQAVTAEDFLNAMSVASGRDFKQFQRWYSQAGTPTCKVTSHYDKNSKTYELTVEQSCPPTPGQPKKEPFYFPLSMGLLNAKGQDMGLKLEGDTQGGAETTKVLHVSKQKQTFKFVNVTEEPTPSLLRNFSAPVKLEYDYSDKQLTFLLANDSDPFNRYEAGQRLALKSIRNIVEDLKAGKQPHVSKDLLDAFADVLGDRALDPAFRAEVLTLPSLETIVESMRPVDFEAAEKAREVFVRAIVDEHRDLFLATYKELRSDLEGAHANDAEARGKRALKNAALIYIMRLNTGEGVKLAYDQFTKATNMTDEHAALTLLCDTKAPEKDRATQAFYNKWRDNPLVLDKWFAAQALARRDDAFQSVQGLEKHPAFDPFNANKLRSLYHAYAQNYPRFHDISGEGYRFIADKVIEIDKYNQNVAAALAKTFNQYERSDQVRKDLMKAQLERILKTPDLSRGVFEIVSKTLGGA